MNYTKEVSEKLNALLEKNYDAEAGYQQAAEKVENNVLKDFFNRQQVERYNFGHELKSEIQSYGESPEKGTSFKGDAHRTWMNIKSTFTSDNEEAMLEEAIRGEKAAVEEYNEVLTETTLPASTRSLLSTHRDHIQKALNQVNAMEETF